MLLQQRTGRLELRLARSDREARRHGVELAPAAVPALDERLRLGVAARGAVAERGGRVAVHHHLAGRSEEHTSELQSLMRISYAVFCLKKTKTTNSPIIITTTKADTKCQLT